jgi:hypothetical protein
MRVTYLNWVGHKGFYTLEVIGVYTVISTPAKALKIAILTLSLSLEFKTSLPGRRFPEDS